MAVAPAVADYRPTDPQIAWHLARFVEEVRGIPADPVVLRQNWLEAYNYVTDKGALALNDYARNNDPFAKVGKTQISVDVSSVALIRYCWEKGAMYLDTCTEPWPGGYTDPTLPPAKRTNYALREEALGLRASGTRAPTAVLRP